MKRWLKYAIVFVLLQAILVGFSFWAVGLSFTLLNLFFLLVACSWMPSLEHVGLPLRFSALLMVLTVVGVLVSAETYGQLRLYLRGDAVTVATPDDAGAHPEASSFVLERGRVDTERMVEYSTVRSEQVIERDIPKTKVVGRIHRYVPLVDEDGPSPEPALWVEVEPPEPSALATHGPLYALVHVESDPILRKALHLGKQDPRWVAEVLLLDDPPGQLPTRFAVHLLFQLIVVAGWATLVETQGAKIKDALA